MIKDFKKLMENEEDIEALYKKPTKEIIYPHAYITDKNILHMIDILYLPEDKGFKYLLVVVDCNNKLCDGRPLKSLEMDEIIINLDDIYKKSKYLKRPETLQADNQFKTKKFIDYCENGVVHSKYGSSKKNNRAQFIKLKISLPYRHRQQSIIERLNQTLGIMIFLKQADDEVKKGVNNTKWVDCIHSIIDFINKYKMKYLDVDYVKKIEIPDDFVFNSKTRYIIADGVIVKVLLDQPEDIEGRKLQGKHRATDRYWTTDNYKVLNSYLFPGNPPLYKVQNLRTKEIPKALYTNEQLNIL